MPAGHETLTSMRVTIEPMRGRLAEQGNLSYRVSSALGGQPTEVILTRLSPVARDRRVTMLTANIRQMAANEMQDELAPLSEGSAAEPTEIGETRRTQGSMGQAPRHRWAMGSKSHTGDQR
eukprot:s4713_g5.t1